MDDDIYLPFRKTFAYQQQHKASTKQVFPLLCPERERDWLEGWDYQMIYSESGLIEKDCIFQTNHNGQHSTWMVTKYDQTQKSIEFFKLSPGECVIKINIDLEDLKDGMCQSNIQYQYTAVNLKQADFIENHMEEFFNLNMQWWEKAINHYLKTGQMLKKEEQE